MSSANRTVLAVDLGTGGPKVALVGEDGIIAAHTARAVRTRVVPPDHAEQDPEEVWGATADAIREVVARAPDAARSVVGVICSSQFSSIVPVDAAGRPVTDLILWMSRRGAPHSRHILETQPRSIGTWIDVHGAVPMGNDSLSHMLGVKHGQPNAYARTHKFLEPVDFLGHRLTGSFAANACTAFLMLLTDNRRLDEVDYDPDLVAFSGVGREKLPDLVPVDACIGTLRPEIARELGLPAATPVFAGMNDTQAVTVGAGAFRPGHGGLNVGTTMQVLASAERKHTDVESQMVSMPSPIPGRYLALAEIGLGGRVLEHFMREVVHASDALGDHSAADPFARVDEAVRAEPAGSGKLLFLPWLAGALAPNENTRMRGAFLNVSLETTRTRLLRAVLEGLAYHLRWMVPFAERFSGTPFAELRFCGGGAQSDAWAQILADVTDRPVHQLAEARQANTRGAAFLAFHRLGLVDLDDIDRFSPVRRVYEPEPAHRRVYDELFAQFVAAYEQTRPICEALNAG
jgi:xylulokinase